MRRLLRLLLPLETTAQHRGSTGQRVGQDGSGLGMAMMINCQRLTRSEPCGWWCRQHRRIRSTEGSIHAGLARFPAEGGVAVSTSTSSPSCCLRLQSATCSSGVQNCPGSFYRWVVIIEGGIVGVAPGRRCPMGRLQRTASRPSCRCHWRYDGIQVVCNDSPMANHRAASVQGPHKQR